MKVIAVLLMSYIFMFTSNDFIHLEAKGWVEKIVTPDSLGAFAKKNAKPKQLSLSLLPIHELVSMENGDKYLKCYLINNSDTTSIISRADATISGLNSEVRINNKWVSFQTDRGSTCGNSYWKQKLIEEYSLYINFEWNYSNGVKVPFRLSFSHDGKLIRSNEIQVRIPKEAYSYVIPNS
jgi:hypothetical protein